MKGLRGNNTRTSSRNYLTYGLILGVFIILLTYFAVTNQFASYSSKVPARSDGVKVMQIPSEKDDRLQEKNPDEKSFENVKTSEEPEVTKEQDKSTEGEFDNGKMTILLGDENEQEKEQEKIERKEQLDAIKNREEAQKRDEIEVEPTEEETKEETEKRDETLLLNVTGNLKETEKRDEKLLLNITGNLEETSKQDVIQFEPTKASEAPGELQVNLEKERMEKGIKQINNGVRIDKAPHMTFDGFPNLRKPEPLKQLCDQSDGKFDLCDLNGDVRVIGSASVVLLIPPNNGTPTQEYKIKPYSRKYLDNIKSITVKSHDGPTNAPQCSERVDYPGLVIAMGGLSGNYWHDFTDILIPLFIRSRQFNGEVQFLVTNNQPWWTGKYDKIFKALSRYEIINFDGDYEVRCYPRVLVGYGSYKEFSIDPLRAPNNYTMVDFTKFLRRTYRLEREFPLKLGKHFGKKPRLMIISRGNSRKFLNMPDIVQLAEKLGFEVSVIDPSPDKGLADIARTVNSFDVLLGVHGAGLTNCLFLPPNAVLIQVVPYGKVEHLAKIDFGDPAVDMDLNYLEYSITADESTLLDRFGRDHEMIRDPLAIHQRDWTLVAEWYLGKQDIKLDIHRFEPILWQALGFLQ